MRCKEVRQEYTKLKSIEGKLIKQDVWLTQRIGEAGADTKHLDLMDKLVDEQVACDSRLRDIKGKLGQIEQHYGFLKNEKG